MATFWPHTVRHKPPMLDLYWTCRCAAAAVVHLWRLVGALSFISLSAAHFKFWYKIRSTDCFIYSVTVSEDRELWNCRTAAEAMRRLKTFEEQICLRRTHPPPHLPCLFLMCMSVFCAWASVFSSHAHAWIWITHPWPCVKNVLLNWGRGCEGVTYRLALLYTRLQSHMASQRSSRQ